MPKDLNLSQKQAVETAEGPLMIVAGAGTGKTTVISQKIKYLVENDLAEPEEILVLAFNDKAAEEIQQRVDEELKLGYAEMEINTFHGFCQKILQEWGVEIGLNRDFKIMTESESWIFFKKNLDKFDLDYYRPLGNPGKNIHDLLKHFSKCKDELIEPQDYLDYAEDLKLDEDDLQIEEKSRLQELANAYHTYNQLLLDNRALDFGDLIFYAIKLLGKRKRVLNYLQKKFKYILVDEFQDVNWAQYKLVNVLASSAKQLMVVGDDDQSIYAFRGASVSNIMRFKEDYPNAKEVVLTENYRSGQKILDLAYESIKHNNPDRLEEKLKINKALKSALGKDGEVIHIHKNSLEEEVKAVAEEIKKIKSSDKETAWDDFAVLVRANNHALPFAEELERQGIPYEFLASKGLFKQPIVLDSLSFFKVISNHYDKVSVYRLLLAPIWNLKENDLQKLTYNIKRKGIGYYEGLKRAAEFGLSPQAVDVCDRLLGLLHEGMKNNRKLKPHRLLYDFLEKSGYLKYLTQKEKEGDREIIRQIYQLMQFLDYLKKFEENTPGCYLADFMEHFEYVSESGEEGNLYQPDDTPDSVNIITVHKSKGLEFKYVFVVNLTQDRFPSRRRGEPISIPNELIKEALPEGDSHIQEERRLFYVACTRAKDRLYLMSANDYGGERMKKISLFLDEVGYKQTGEKIKKAGLSLEIPIKKEEKGSFIYPIPKDFSPSQINTYLNCPYQYKLQYIIGLKPDPTHHLNFGNSIHHTLHEFYKQVQILNNARQDSLFFTPQEEDGSAKEGKVKVPELKKLLKIYKEKWEGDWFLSKKQHDEYYEKGKKALTDFYNSQEDKWTVPALLESSFKFKAGDAIISGRIDRVDKLPDGTLRIMDYKTGKSKEKAEGGEKIQLLIYQMAAQKLPEYYHLGQVGELVLNYIIDGVETKFLGKEKDLLKVEEKIKWVTDNIKAGNFECESNDFNCKNCPFKHICERDG